MKYNGLRFFNSTVELDLDYDSTLERFEGHAHLNEVSTGLFETMTMFILEEAVSQHGAPVLIKPVSATGTTSFKFNFIDTVYSSKDINLLTAKVVEGEPYVQFETTVSTQLQSNSVAVTTVGGIHTLGSSYSKEALQVNAALNSETEGPHSRDLYIFDEADNHLVAVIHIYGETVEEDERLAVLLSNLGANLSTADQFLFKDHDINELGTDWILLNSKRKELLLELSNIKPFVGTYKALLNAIKFFGYNNLTLKEYWLAVDDRSPMFGKLKAFEIPSSLKGSYVSNKIRGIQLPSSSYKKTSRFGLFYKLNEPNGQFDEWDIAQVNEVFDFTPEEVLIKLYGLKGKLQRDYLPLSAKIVDIIGEADYFASYNVNTWNNQNPISVVEAGTDPSITIHQPEAFIEDLTAVSSILTGKDQDFTQLTGSQLASLYSDVKSFYEGYYNSSRTTFEDFGLVPVGAPVMLECTSFPDTWNDAEFVWLDAESYITWDNWWKRNVYELRWIISGPRGWNLNLIGSIDDLLKVAISLPYSGKYTVRFEQIDLFNNASVLPQAGVINAKVKSLEMYSVYKWMDRESYEWQSSNFKWSKAGGSWGFPQQNDDTVDQEIATLYLTLDRANYLQDGSKGINFSMVKRYVDASSPSGFSETAGPYFWRNLKSHAWNDGKHTWWDSTRVGSDLAASFKIEDADAGSSFTIDYPVNENVTTSSTYVFVNDLTDPTNLIAWQAEADLLNASTDPIISKFNYNPVFIDNDNDGTIDECPFILAVGKEYSSGYDFSDVREATLSVGSVGITGKNRYTAYNPTFNDVQIAEDHAEIELLTHMTFSADKSRMPGKVKYNWTIRNNNTNESDIYYNSKWLTFLFQTKGDYTIELEVDDVNGNTNKLVKNALTIK